LIPYSEEYYQWLQKGALNSAKEIVPFILDYIKPKSVIDIGCGVGTWLSVFKDLGVQEIVGVDGDYVKREMLQIPEESFINFDLTKPFQLDKKFDLVVSLEVAEHLPASCAEIFVDTLTSLGPVILFSAALPYQGGHNHFNEQWAEYWASLFKQKGYEVIDCIRREVWWNANVDWWYAQNILIYADHKYLSHNAKLIKEFEKTNPSHLSIIHPSKYLSLISM
jgi:SAM-dependent methyltransferase